MASGNVIVFGPTGNIASVTAITAQELGSKVFLAMRDPKKAIPGLSPEQEAAGGFERIQADLSQPETVAAAVSKAGAKRAFLNLVHGSPDHMKATFEALKSGGVELVVFLSSYTVSEPLEKYPQSDLIPFMHARAEISLREVFSDDGFVAVRPGCFATNTPGWWKMGLSGDAVKTSFPEANFDWITPRDMGGVCGSILANGQKGGQNVVYLLGPEMMPQKEAFGIVAKALGKSVEVTKVSEEEGVELFKKIMPEFFARYIATKLADEGQGNNMAKQPWYEEAVNNVKKYTEKPGLKFEEWVQENKLLFV